MPACMLSKLFQSRPTLAGPMDCSPRVSSVHGLLQTRILEWVAISSSRALPKPHIKLKSPKALVFQKDPLPLAPPGKPINYAQKSLKVILKREIQTRCFLLCSNCRQSSGNS